MADGRLTPEREQGINEMLRQAGRGNPAADDYDWDGAVVDLLAELAALRADLAEAEARARSVDWGDISSLASVRADLAAATDDIQQVVTLLPGLPQGRSVRQYVADEVARWEADLAAAEQDRDALQRTMRHFAADVDSRIRRLAAAALAAPAGKGPGT